MTTDQIEMIERGNANLAKMNPNGDGAIRMAGAEVTMGEEGVGNSAQQMRAEINAASYEKQFNDAIVAGSAIPPAEPTRKRREAVKGLCRHCGKNYSRHRIEAGEPEYCIANMNNGKPLTVFDPGEPPAPAVTASTKQEGGAFISIEQAAHLDKLVNARRDAEREVAKYEGLHLDACRAYYVYLDELQGKRAKDAR